MNVTDKINEALTLWQGKYAKTVSSDFNGGIVEGLIIIRELIKEDLPLDTLLDNTTNNYQIFWKKIRV